MGWVIILVGIGLIIYWFCRKSRNTSSEVRSQVEVKISSPNKSTEWQHSESYELLRKATKLKKEGDIEGAIDALRRAYAKSKADGTKCEPGDCLRLPNYLRLAGRNDEAWKEYNRLLLEYTSPLEQWKIYDKMRLHLQREQKPDRAVIFGIFSLLMEEMWFQELKRAEGKDALPDWRSEPTTKEDVKDVVNGLLKKAKREELTQDIANITWQELRRLPKCDLASISESVGVLLRKE